MTWLVNLVVQVIAGVRAAVELADYLEERRRKREAAAAPPACYRCGKHVAP